MFYLFPERFFNAFSPVVGAIELPVQCPNERNPPLQPAVRGEGEGKPQLQVGFGVKFVARWRKGRRRRGAERRKGASKKTISLRRRITKSRKFIPLLFAQLREMNRARDHLLVLLVFIHFASFLFLFCRGCCIASHHISIILKQIVAQESCNRFFSLFSQQTASTYIAQLWLLLQQQKLTF